MKAVETESAEPQPAEAEASVAPADPDSTLVELSSAVPLNGGDGRVDTPGDYGGRSDQMITEDGGDPVPGDGVAAELGRPPMLHPGESLHPMDELPDGVPDAVRDEILRSTCSEHLLRRRRSFSTTSATPRDR